MTFRSFISRVNFKIFRSFHLKSNIIDVIYIKDSLKFQKSLKHYDYHLGLNMDFIHMPFEEI